MTETIRLGDLAIAVTRKKIKHVHLSVHPPQGRVTLVAPLATRLEVARAYAISKLAWIRTQQARLESQARESARLYVERESHYIWGRRYLLSVAERDEKPSVTLAPGRLTLCVRPGTAAARRAEIMGEWQRQQLHAFLGPQIAKWEGKLKVKVRRYFLQRMKTKWGACNHRRGTLRFNTELIKKPADLVEYVVVHEMTHLREPHHNEAFKALLAKHFPGWREARAELNELPLGAELWRE